MAADRRANRWHYLLEDRAKAFQDARTLWKKWKALLSVGIQCRLAWARVRGQFRYGSRRSYAALSLARLPARPFSIGGSFVLILSLLVLWIFSNLLLLAHFGKEGTPQPILVDISQETLAEMIGTTRSRVSFFMNKFRKLGLISYNGKIEVHNSLLNAVLREKPEIERDDPQGKSNPQAR